METPNNNYIDQLSGDDNDFRVKMITILKQELPEEVALYQESITASDFKESALMVHKLKHKISILGLEKSYYLAETYEKELKEQVTSSRQEFEDVLQTMQDFVVELK